MNVLKTARISNRSRVKALAAMAATGFAVSRDAAKPQRTLAQDSVELRMLSWTPRENQEGYEAMLADFSSAHPEITIQLEAVPGGGAATYPDVLRTAIASGDAPDLFHMWGGSLAAPYIEAEQALDLSPYVEEYNWTERIIPWVYEDLQVDDVLYGAPMAARAMGFWYRKDIFEEHGIQVPQTYADVEAAATTLSEAGIAFLSMGGQFGYNTMRLLDYFLELKAGPELHDQLNQLEASWDSPEVVEAYELLQKWTDNGWIVDGFMAVAPEDASIPWYAGQAATVFEGDWVEVGLINDEQDLANYGMFVAPTDQEPLRVSGFCEQIMISSTSENADAAAVFLDWYLQPEVQQKHFEALGSSSGVVDVVPDPERLPTTAEWRETITELASYPPTDQAFDNELMDQFFTVQDSIVGGQISPEEGAKQMEAAAEAWRQANPE